MATFSWASAADVGLGLLSGFAQGQAAKATAKAENEVRAANNSVARSSSMLARTIQNINNKRIMQTAGKNFDTLRRSISATQDIQARGGFEASVRTAEQLGAASSAAAAAGITGGNLGTLLSVSGMAAGRAAEYRNIDNKRNLTNQFTQLETVMGDALRSLDNSPIVPQQDYTQSYSGSMIGYLMNGLMSKKDSIHTMLGSLAPDPTPATPGLTAANKASTITQGVYQGNVVGTPLISTQFGQVTQGNVTPTMLPALSPSVRIK